MAARTRNEWDVIVVGCGLAGMSAAATASQAGARVLVLEAHRPGGRARTAERDGFTLNMGAHALYKAGPGSKVLRSLGITPVGAPPPLRRYRALTAGVQHVLPTGPGSLLRTRAVSTRSKAQLAELLVRLPRMSPASLGKTSVADWLASCRLRPDAEAVLRALIRLGTYTADVDEFSADAAVSQLQAAASGGVLYLHGGWSQLIDALAECSRSEPAPRSPASNRSGGRVEVRTRDARAGRRPGRRGHGWPGLGPPASARPTRAGATSDHR